MRKTFNAYIIVWIICYALFNAITFIVPSEGIGIYKYEPSFWIGYLSITIAFIVQLVTGCITFKQGSPQKFFYNIPLLRISCIGLIAMLAAGGIGMIVKPWMAAILCLIVLSATIGFSVAAKSAAQTADTVDEKIKHDSYYIRVLTVDVERIMMRSASEEIKAECKKVYEAVRYSDPMSHPALEGVEKQISSAYNVFSNAVMTNDPVRVRMAANDMIILIGDRNSHCKLLK